MANENTARIIEVIRGNGTMELKDLISSVQIEAATVFVEVRKLEREGVVESVQPGVYQLNEAEVPANLSPRESHDSRSHGKSSDDEEDFHWVG